LKKKYESYFNCNIIDNSSNNRFVFPINTLKEKFQNSNEDILNILETKAKELLRVSNNNNYVNKVKKSISIQLGNFVKPSLELTAKELGYSVRAIQQKLKAENSSYREILEETRKEISKNLILNNIQISEVAFILGFTEVSSFNKAFKKWYGHSPTSSL